MRPAARLGRVAALAAALAGAAAADAYLPPPAAAARTALLEAVGRAVAAAPCEMALDLTGRSEYYHLTALAGGDLTLTHAGAVLHWPAARLRPAQLLVIGAAGIAAPSAELLVVADYALATGACPQAAAVLEPLTGNAALADAVSARRAWIHSNPAACAAPATTATAALAMASPRPVGAVAGEGGDPPAPTPPPAPPAPPAVDPLVGDAPDPARKLTPDAVLRLVMDRSPAGINRRLGPDAAFYHKSAAAPHGKADAFPTIWQAPRQKGEGTRVYQVGGPWTKAAGDFSSAQGQVLYAGAGLGIDRVTIIEMTNNCFTESPEPPWWGGFRPEPNSKDWAASAAGGVVGIARGILTWSNCAVIVFANGQVCTAGTCTAFGSDPVLRLPEGKLPTAVCVTPRNEFALVTVCDTTSKPHKAQLAVIALTGCKPGFAHDWQVPHPGMPSVAMYAGMKLLGFVDLPGLTVPTAVSAGEEYGGERLSDPKSGNIGTFRDYDLATEGSRNALRGYVSGAGFAVVAACYEDKVAFVDLQPLFQYYRAMYCGSAEDYRKTCAQGPAPGEWPYAFTSAAAQAPVVVKVLRAPQPTAVLAGLGMKEQARAYVACRDGRVAVYKLGGLATEAPCADGDVAALEAVPVGRNPVSLAYQRYTRDEIVVVSRGDRELAWIRTGATGSAVVRRLRDARLIDPVCCEVAETHGIETALVTVCDFAGRKIVNYRFGQLRFVTNGGAAFGMGPAGKDEFECGGTLEFPGPVFALSATNVN